MQKPISGPKLFRRGFTGRSDARQIPGLLVVPQIRCRRLTEWKTAAPSAAGSPTVTSGLSEGKCS